MAYARETDPHTSHLAAAEAERSGRAMAQRARCLEAVVLHPGWTAAELALSAGLERHAPSRRLPELRETGHVRNGMSRCCRITGRLSLVWLPCEEE